MCNISSMFVKLEDLIISLSRIFHLGCLSLVYDEELDLNSLKQWRNLSSAYKNIGFSFIPISVLCSKSFDHTIQKEYCRNNYSFYVVITVTRGLLEHLSYSGLLSHSFWVFFIRSDNIQDIFRGLYIPLNSNVLIAHSVNKTLTITEIYQVVKNGDFIMNIIYRNSGDNVKYYRNNYLERRSNFHGALLKIVTVQDYPFNYFKNVENKTIFTGYVGEMITQLQQQMNFTMEIETPVDQKYGNKVNGCWNGMLGELSEGRADVAATTFLVSPERKEDFDISLSILPLQYEIFISETNGRVMGFVGILKPFSYELWIAVAMFIIVAGILRWFFSNMNPGNPVEEQISLECAMFYTVGCVITMQSEPRTPKFLPSFIVFFLSYLLAIVLHDAYSAILISFIAINKQKVPFSTLEELLQDGTYKVGVKKGTAQYQMFRDAKSGVLKKLYETLLVKTDKNIGNLEHLNSVCNGRYAYIVTPETAYSLAAQLNCTLKSLPEVFGKFSGSMAFPKGSPLTEIFNYNIEKLFSNGFFKKLYTDTWKINWIQLSDYTMNAVSMNDTISYFTILGIGLLVAIVLVILENIVVKCQNYIDNIRSIKYMNNIHYDNFKWTKLNNKLKYSTNI